MRWPLQQSLPWQRATRMLPHESIILEVTTIRRHGPLRRIIGMTSGGQSMELLSIERVGDFGMDSGITLASARLIISRPCPRAAEAGLDEPRYLSGDALKGASTPEGPVSGVGLWFIPTANKASMRSGASTARRARSRCDVDPHRDICTRGRPFPADVGGAPVAFWAFAYPW
jgi:hypothetical protein